MTASVEPERFRRWMARWATGVTVVTARDGERDFGLTVNAFLSVSLDPPIVLVSLGEEANTTPVVLRTRRFVVNLLKADQASVSRRFAQVGSGDTKFDRLGFHRGPDGIARLDGTLGALACEVTEERRVADHRLVLGAVSDIEPGEEGLPLVYFRGGYAESDGPRGVRVTLPEK